MYVSISITLTFFLTHFFLLPIQITTYDRYRERDTPISLTCLNLINPYYNHHVCISVRSLVHICCPPLLTHYPTFICLRNCSYKCYRVSVFISTHSDLLPCSHVTFVLCFTSLSHSRHCNRFTRSFLFFTSLFLHILQLHFYT